MLKKMAVGQLQANCYILGCNNTSSGFEAPKGPRWFQVFASANHSRECRGFHAGCYSHGGVGQLQQKGHRRRAKYLEAQDQYARGEVESP